jgi:hypothetical protein
VTADSKSCPRCGQDKPLADFGRNRARADGLAAYCRPCARAAGREANRRRDPVARRQGDNRRRAADPARFREAERRRYEVNPVPVLAAVARHRSRVRAQVFAHYGQACACCGRSDQLTIDHVNGDGDTHRRELFGKSRAGGVRFYAWLVRQGFPPGYQTLCHPCNTSKGGGLRCIIRHDDPTLF